MVLHVHFTKFVLLSQTGESVVNLLNEMNNNQEEYRQLCHCCNGVQIGPYGDNKNVYKKLGFLSKDEAKESPDELSDEEKEALRIRYHNAVQAFKKRAKMYYIKEYLEFDRSMNKQLYRDLSRLEDMLLEYAKNRQEMCEEGLGIAQSIRLSWC